MLRKRLGFGYGAGVTRYPVASPCVCLAEQRPEHGLVHPHEASGPPGRAFPPLLPVHRSLPPFGPLRRLSQVYLQSGTFVQFK